MGALLTPTRPLGKAGESVVSSGGEARPSAEELAACGPSLFRAWIVRSVLDRKDHGFDIRSGPVGARPAGTVRQSLGGRGAIALGRLVRDHDLEGTRGGRALAGRTPRHL